MSEPKKPQQPEWPISSTPAKPADRKKPDAETTGRIVHDARGNAVWNWTGKTDNDSTTHLLRQLDSPELALEDDKSAKTADPPADPGINPYNQRNEQRTVATPRAGAATKEPEDKNAPKDSVLRQLLGKR